MRFNRIAPAVSMGLLIVIASANVQARGPIDDSDKHGIAAKDLKARLDANQKTIIIDARGHLDGQMIKGAAHVPTSKLEEWAKSAVPFLLELGPEDNGKQLELPSVDAAPAEP